MHAIGRSKLQPSRPCTLPALTQRTRRPPQQRMPAAACLKCATRQLLMFAGLPGLQQDQQQQQQQVQLLPQNQQQQQPDNSDCTWGRPLPPQQLAWAGMDHMTTTSSCSSNSYQQSFQQPLLCAATSGSEESNNSGGSSSGSIQPIISGLPPLSTLLGEPTATSSISSSALQHAAAAAAAEEDRAAASSSPHSGTQPQSAPVPAEHASVTATSAATTTTNSSSSSSASASSRQPPGSKTASAEAPAAHEDSPGVRAALALLRWYKGVMSPLMQPSCRFLPTCSQYSMDAYRGFGLAKGTVLTAWRLLRCNPLGPSGYDPAAWPPPGLELLFRAQYSAEVAVLVGGAAFWRLGHALLFE